MEKFENYMFFENLEQLSRDINKLMSLDKNKIDSALSDGHDWVSEHVTTAKDDIEEITNFLLSKLDGALEKRPFKEELYENGIVRRTFTKDVDTNELEWHRDAEDRVVKAVNENDWMIQFDNELPRKMNVNEEFSIPKESFHRVIKGSTDLVVEVQGINEKDDRCTRIAKRKYDTWPSAYASGAVVQCRQGKIWKGIKEEDISEETLSMLEDVQVHEKTDYSKEKDKGLHGWFERQGGEGKSSGWVDCNTCRKDPKTGKKKCKSCGRKEGEKRSKYPSCRPTPSACSTKGKGKKWGKKSKKEESLNLSEENGIFVENENMAEPTIKPKTVPEVKPGEERTVPRRTRIFKPNPKVQPKPKMNK